MILQYALSECPTLSEVAVAVNASREAVQDAVQAQRIPVKEGRISRDDVADVFFYLARTGRRRSAVVG